jgi:hypothetical protein
MNIPRFTAEASLYKTSSHYRTHGGRKAVDPSRRPGSQIWAALMEEDGEVIHVHSCAPGYTEIGGVCWQNPLTEPPVGGGDWPPGGPFQVPPDGPGGNGGGDTRHKGCNNNCNSCYDICEDDHPVPKCWKGEPKSHCDARKNAAKADQKKCRDENCPQWCGKCVPKG